MIVLTRISLINLKNNRMDKLEYIPGDLVKFATNTYTIVNFGENFLQSKIYALISTNSTKTAFVEDRDILPIPLTPEILEKNGWELDSATWIYKKDILRCLNFLMTKPMPHIYLKCEFLNFILFTNSSTFSLVLELITKWRCRYGQ